MEKEKFEGWMMLELMGHRKLAGYVSEEERFGIMLCRIDIPTTIKEKTTQYYHPNSIYCMTPIKETDAIQLAKMYRPNPFSHYDLHRESNLDLNIVDCPNCGKKFDSQGDEIPF